jgi:hypothetical protein
MTGLTSIPDHLPAVVAHYAQWPAIRHESGCEEDDCYDSFVRKLGGYGALIDPRAPKYRVSSLDDHARSEVRRSIHRIRMLRRIRRPLDGPKPTAEELRSLGRVLAEVAFTTAQATAARELETLDCEPPELAGAIKYHCAEEACYLIGCFSSSPRDHLNSSDRDAFYVITKKLFEAVTGEVDADVSRARDHVLKNWRRFAPKGWLVGQLG